jgi:glutamine cyclotransferase
MRVALARALHFASKVWLRLRRLVFGRRTRTVVNGTSYEYDSNEIYINGVKFPGVGKIKFESEEEPHP